MRPYIGAVCIRKHESNLPSMKPLGMLKSTQELIINLHGVGPPHDSISPGESSFWISEEVFANFLDLIVSAKRETSVPIVVTFDDGNMSDAAIALPELVRRGLKAIFFVCARRIGMPHYVDRIAILEMLAAGMEIGSHGMKHRDWRRLDEPTLKIEIGVARRHIEDVCGIAVKKAAIPFGSYDRTVLKHLRREQFDCVYTSDRGMARSRAWLKPRNTVDKAWSEADVIALLKAKSSLATRLRLDAAMFYKRLR